MSNTVTQRHNFALPIELNAYSKEFLPVVKVSEQDLRLEKRLNKVQITIFNKIQSGKLTEDLLREFVWATKSADTLSEVISISQMIAERESGLYKSLADVAGSQKGNNKRGNQRAPYQ